MVKSLASNDNLLTEVQSMDLTKRLAVIIAFVVILSYGGIPVAISAGDDYEAAILGAEDDSVKHNGKDTFIIEFQVKANNGAMVQGVECILAYDTSVFDLVTMDGTQNLTETGIAAEPGLSLLPDPPLYDFTPALPSGWNPMICVAMSSDRETGYVAMQAFRMSATTIPSFTTLQKIRLAFKPGKSLDDVSTDTVRFVAVSEMPSLGGADCQAQIFDENAIAYKYGMRNGTPNTLSALVFEMETGKGTTNNAISPTSPREPESDFEYILADGEITIIGYNGNSDVIEVPSEIDGYPVVAVEDGVFSDLPDDVTISSSDAAIRSVIEESGVPSERVVDNEKANNLSIGKLIAVLSVIVILGSGVILYCKIIRARKETTR